MRIGNSSTPSNTRIYAIGDVHGYLSLLERLCKKIRDDLQSIGTMNYKIVFLGDYIDRGPDSAGCVQFLIELLSENNNVICLKGNHEDKLERFLANPLAVADSFFGYGGIECAMSYGVNMKGFGNTPDEALSIGAELAQRIPSEHKQLYATLGKSAIFGDYFFAHAGVRPGVVLNEQLDDDLMCIRSEFLSHTGQYDKVIVHGHTPTYPMEMLSNRVNVDTGAYDTGVLSCLVLEGMRYKVIEAT